MGAEDCAEEESPKDMEWIEIRSTFWSLDSDSSSLAPLGLVSVPLDPKAV